MQAGEPRPRLAPHTMQRCLAGLQNHPGQSLSALVGSAPPGLASSTTNDARQHDKRFAAAQPRLGARC